MPDQVSSSPPLTAKRLSRRDSQAETRARLMTAALALIAHQGVEGTSIRGICEQAGYSQGAFYSNFDSKTALLVALVADHTATLAAELRAIVAPTSGDRSFDDDLDRLTQRLAALARDPVQSLLVVELHLHARRDPGFAVRFDAVRRIYHREFTRVAQTLIDTHALRPIYSAETISLIMMALWSGGIIQAGGDDDPAPAELLARVLRPLVGHLPDPADCA